MPVADAPAQHAPARTPAHHAAAHLDRIERAVVAAVDRVRRRHGLPRLRRSSALTFVAAAHSTDQARHHSLSHSSSDGTPFATRIRRAARARSVGETLIEYSGEVTGARIVRAWMHSPPHRRDLLSRAFRRVGVGRADVGGTSVVTADFASRR